MIHFIFFIVLTILLAYASWTDVCRDKYVGKINQWLIYVVGIAYILLSGTASYLSFAILWCALMYLIPENKYFGIVDIGIVLALIMFLQSLTILFIINLSIIASLYWLMFLVKRCSKEKNLRGLFRGIEVPFVPVIFISFVYTELFRSFIFVSYITGGI